MRYLSGVTNDRDEPQLIEAGIGLMLQPGSGYRTRAARYPFHAADNGCFADKWNEDKWLHWLETVPVDGCLFAVAPDVYPNAEATLERSAPYFDVIRSMGFPVALVAQNGAESLDLPWDEFDCLFIGGASAKPSWQEWKVSPQAEELVHRARNHGKWVHAGRVNSLGRLEKVRRMGCNSADGTFLKYRLRSAATDVEGDREARGAVELARWHEWLAANQPLPLMTFETPALPVYKELLSA